MTSLLNGQAVKLAFCSTSVTASRGSRRFSARAQVAPAKPPPITTTRPAEPCASAGRNGSGAQAASAACFRNWRRVVRPPFISAASLFLGGVPRRDRRELGFREALDDAVHHRRRALPGTEGLQRGDDFRRGPA